MVSKHITYAGALRESREDNKSMIAMEFDDNQVPAEHRTKRELIDSQGSEGLQEPLISPVSLAVGSKFPTEARGDSMYLVAAISD